MGHRAQVAVAITASLIVLSLGACGAAPAAVRPPVGGERPTPPPAQPTAAWPSGLREALVSGATFPAAFGATLTVEEQLGSEQQRHVYDVRYRHRPTVSRLEVKESSKLPRGLLIGAAGGDKVKIRLPGLIRFIAIEVDARSETSRGLLGLYPDQTTPDAFVKVLLAPSSRLRPLGAQRIDGEPLWVVEAQGPLAVVAGATIRVGFAGAHPLPRLMELRRRDGGVFRQRYTRFVPRPWSEAELTL